MPKSTGRDTDSIIHDSHLHRVRAVRFIPIFPALTLVAVRSAQPGSCVEGQMKKTFLRIGSACGLAMLFFGSSSVHAFCTEFDIAGIGVNCVDEGHKRVTQLHQADPARRNLGSYLERQLRPGQSPWRLSQ